ncbi:SRPBCC domain-containing protein [Sandaracinus amylolyticus]|uniref:SRPBCC domain-containing protein n=1 Tax=Sandaracinus amylolyticus TaxID=927083 RepID=UPI001F279CFF|nr:SRPBCC domain-containing protein [Sandaracinus amylolyticus]UJR84756.1 Hypothetical protein I5071_68350 [Sandaracinus amylolyticus]
MRSADHSTFVIERVLAASPARAFAAWSDPEKKRRWMSCHDDWKLIEDRLDFRIDGAEIRDVQRPDGVVHAFRARYLDIVPLERIVYAYEMRVGDARISASLVTVELSPSGTKTTMRFTEQVVFFDGHGDLEERRRGTEIGLDHLVAMLDGA